MMIDDTTRNSVADQLEHDAVYLDGSSLSEWWARLQSVACDYEDFPDPRSLFTRLAGLIRPNPINGSTSDGYHTFDELYHHRAVLFSVVVSAFPDKAWKAKAHSDGTMYDGMFIVGIDTPDGQATYHYDIDPYWGMFRCKELDRAPEWDGHTPEQAIERIGKLTGLIDRATTHLRERRNRQWWESRARCGYATVCPLCGGYTLSKTGYHAGCAKKAGIKIPRQRMKRALLIAKERQKIPVAQMAGPVGAVVRDDGVRFESAGAAALATYGYCGSPNIVRAVRTGCKAGGHYWKRADEEDK